MDFQKSSCFTEYKMTENNFDQNESLIDMDSNKWTYRNSFEGVQIFGSIGSGKTSGSGQLLAKAFLTSGYGGLVLTAKSDERETWEHYCEKFGRSDDLIIFSPDNVEHCAFNFLNYEATRKGVGGGVSRNIVSLFLAVVDLAETEKNNSGGGDRFWRDTLIQLLDNAIDLLMFAEEPVSMINIKKVINTAPKSLSEVSDESWKKSSFCYQTLAKGLFKSGDDEARSEHYKQAQHYWMDEFPRIPEKTRSTIELTFTSIASLFLRPPLVDLMCRDTKITPEITQEGKIIVLDLSVQEWNEIGRYAQVLLNWFGKERQSGVH